MSENASALNTDRELWREREGDYYADSIHVTKQGGIGINCGGHVIVRSLKNWHGLAKQPSDTERQAQAFWERAYLERRSSVTARAMKETLGDKRVIPAEQVCAEEADAALAEWRKRWGTK